MGIMIPTRADHPSPDVKPTYSNLFVDDEGNLWVQRYRSSFLGELPIEEPERWWVFAGDGRWLGEVALPYRFQLHEVSGGYAVGVALDELDVPRVQLLRIVR